MKFSFTFFFLIIFCSLYSQDSTLNGYAVYYKTPFVKVVQPPKAKDGKIKVYRNLGIPFFLIPRRKPDVGLKGGNGIPGDDYEVYLRKDTLGLVKVRVRNVDRSFDLDIVFYIDLENSYLKLTFKGGDGGNGASGGDWFNKDRNDCIGVGGKGGDGGDGGRAGMVDVYYSCDTSNVSIQSKPGEGGNGGNGGNQQLNYDVDNNCSANKGSNGKAGVDGEKINDVAFISKT